MINSFVLEVIVVLEEAHNLPGFMDGVFNSFKILKALICWILYQYSQSA